MKKLFVIGMAALLLVAFTMPAMAKVKVGGIVFTDFYYLDRDKENAHFWGQGNGDDSYSNTTIQVPNITRLYARWTNEDNVGMYIEWGLGQKASGIEGSSDDDGSFLRHAYGWWDVNPMFSLLVGKTTTPFSPLNPSQLLGTRDGSLNIIGAGYGEFYSGRFAQVRGTFRFGKMARLEVALVDQHGGNQGPWTYKEDNMWIPRVDIGVPLYFGPIHVYPSFLWNYKTVDQAQPAVDDNITTWVGSIATKMGFGPFGLSAEGQYGQNWGNTRGLIGIGFPQQISAAHLTSNDTNIEDAKTWGFWIDASWKFGSITPHIIWGMMNTENEDYNPTTNTNYDVEGQTMMLGISVPIDLAKGFRIRPEVFWYDDGDKDYSGTGAPENVNLGKYLVAGVQFQITF